MNWYHHFEMGFATICRFPSVFSIERGFRFSWLVGSFPCRSKAFPKRTYHTQFTTMRLDRIVELRTHFNLATICNLYDNVHFDVELAVNTCKTITATISKCASRAEQVLLLSFSIHLHLGHAHNIPMVQAR